MMTKYLVHCIECKKCVGVCLPIVSVQSETLSVLVATVELLLHAFVHTYPAKSLFGILWSDTRITLQALVCRLHVDDLHVKQLYLNLPLLHLYDSVTCLLK